MIDHVAQRPADLVRIDHFHHLKVLQVLIVHRITVLQQGEMISRIKTKSWTIFVGRTDVRPKLAADGVQNAENSAEVQRVQIVIALGIRRQRKIFRQRIERTVEGRHADEFQGRAVHRRLSGAVEGAETVRATGIFVQPLFQPLLAQREVSRSTRRIRSMFDALVSTFFVLPEINRHVPGQVRRHDETALDTGIVDQRAQGDVFHVTGLQTRIVDHHRPISVLNQLRLKNRSSLLLAETQVGVRINFVFGVEKIHRVNFVGALRRIETDLCARTWEKTANVLDD